MICYTIIYRNIVSTRQRVRLVDHEAGEAHVADLAVAPAVLRKE